MKQAVVTKIDVEHASYTVEYLKSAVQELSKIHAQVFRYDADKMARVTEFLEFAQGELANAQAVVEQAQTQYADRDQDLIGAATSRYFAIDNDIEMARHSQQAARNVYANKCQELRHKKFTNEEISKIVAKPDAEVAALETIIENLAQEKLKIQKFLESSPEYNFAHLVGTRVSAVLELRIASGLTTTKV